MSLKMNNDYSKKASQFILKTTPSTTSPTKTNDRIIKENQKYKSQIVILNDKINQLNIILQNEKTNNEKKENELVDKYKKEIKKLKQKVDLNQDDIAKIENSYKIRFNDSQKQKQILEQKNKNLVKQIDELTRKEKILNSDFDLQLKERIQANKKSNKEYEKVISQLNSKIEILLTKNIDLESNLKSKEIIIENSKANENEIKNRHKEEIKELNNKIKELKKKIEELRNQAYNELQSKENLIQQLMEDHRNNEDENYIKLKENTDKLKAKAYQFEQEYYKEKQKNEFLESTNKDLKEQIEQMKKNQTQILEMLDWKSVKEPNNISSLNEKVDNLENIYLREKEYIENNFKKEKESYIKDVKDKNENILQLKELCQKLESENDEYMTQIKSLNEKNLELEKKLKLTEDIRNHFYDELTKENKITIGNFEKKLSEKEQEHQEYIKELNESNEKTLNQLKEIFEEEKKRLENKISNQKRDNEKNLNNIILEYEKKLKEQEKDIRIEYENLQNDFDDLEAKYNTLSVDAEHQISMLNQKLMTAESINADHKDNLINITKEHNNALQKKLSEFNIERKDLIKKIDTLKQNLINKNQEIKTLNNSITDLNNVIQEKDYDISSQKKEYETAIENLVTKFEQYKQKQQEILNDFNIKKRDYNRELSLLKQQIGYLNKKLQEQVSYNEEIDKQHDENIIELKNELEENFNNKINEILIEKKNLSEKLKEVENQLKESEERIISISTYYENKLVDEKNNHKMIYNELENQLQSLNLETEDLKNKSSEPIKKINELLEIQTHLQNENSLFKDDIHNLEKEKEELEKNIEILQKEKNELIQENENLNESITHLESQLKYQIPKATSDLRKKLKNFGSNSLNMINPINFDKTPKNSLRTNQSEIYENSNVLNSFVGDLVSNNSRKELNKSAYIGLKKYEKFDKIDKNVYNKQKNDKI